MLKMCVDTHFAGSRLASTSVVGGNILPCQTGMHLNTIVAWG